MYCMKCGRQMPDAAKFCTGCGAPMYKEVPAPQPTPEAGSPQSEETAADRPKKSRKGLVAAITVLLILAAAGGGAAWYFLGVHGISQPETVQAAPTGTPASDGEAAGTEASPTAAAATPAPTETPPPAFGNLDRGQSGEYEMSYAARVDGVILSVPNSTGSALDHLEAATEDGEGGLTISSSTLPGDYHSLVAYRGGVAAIEWGVTSSIVWIDPHTMEKTVLYDPGQEVYLGSALCVWDGDLYFSQLSGEERQFCRLDRASGGASVVFSLWEDAELESVTDRGVYLGVWDSELSAYQIRLYDMSGNMLNNYADAASVYGVDSPSVFLRETEAGVYLLFRSGDGGSPVILREDPAGTLTNISEALAKQGVFPAGENARFMDDDSSGELYILCPEDGSGATGIYRVDEADLSAQRAAGLQIDVESGSYMMSELYAVDRDRFLVRTYDLFSSEWTWQFVTNSSETSAASAASDAAEAVSPTPRPRGAVYGGSGLAWSDAARVGDVVMTTVTDISDSANIHSCLDVQRLNEDGTWSPIAVVDGAFTSLIPWNGVICGQNFDDGVSITAVDPDTMVKKVLYALPDGQYLPGPLGVGNGCLYFSIGNDNESYVCHMEPDGTMVRDFPLARNGDAKEFLEAATDSGLFISSWDQDSQYHTLRLAGFDGQTRMEFSTEIGTDFLAETDLRVYTTLSDEAGNYRVMGQDKQTGEVVDVTAALAAQGLDFSGPPPSWDVGNGTLYLLMPETSTTACFVYKVDEQTLQAEDLLQNSIRGGEGTYWTASLYVVTEERVIIRHENQDTFGTILSYY